MSTVIPSGEGDDSAQLMTRYVRACGNLLSSFGNIEDVISTHAYGHNDSYTELVTQVGGLLLQLVGILVDAGLVRHCISGFLVLD